MLDGQAVAAVIGKDFYEIVSSYFSSPMFARRATDLGLDALQYYVAGRAGVLGDVRPETVASLIWIIPPAAVAKLWVGARQLRPLDEIVVNYSDGIAEWSRTTFSSADWADRLVALLTPLVDRLDLTGAPLAAGWREVPLPDDPPSRMVRLANLLREHRGAWYLTALLAQGVKPVDAIVSAQGIQTAQYLRWPPPLRVPGEDVMQRRRDADSLTDRMTAPAYAGISPEDAAELVELAHLARNHCRLARTG